MEATRRGRPLGPGRINHQKVEATSEADTRRHMVEDGFDPDNPLQGLRPTIAPASIRARLGMSQAVFAKALRVPLATLQNWEQGRTIPDPAARSLLVLVNRDPERAFKVLAE